MKVLHVVQILKGPLLYKNLIFHFISVLTDGLRMMLLPKSLFQFDEKWLKILKSKKPGWGRPRESKSFEFLLFQMNDPLWPVKLRFLEETAKKLNNFLLTFQINSLVVPFIVDSLENLIHRFFYKVYITWYIEKGQHYT